MNRAEMDNLLQELNRQLLSGNLLQVLISMIMILVINRKTIFLRLVQKKSQLYAKQNK